MADKFENIKRNIIKASGGKLNERDVEAIKHGNINAASKALSPAEKQMLLKLLNDKNAAKKILNDPKIRNLFGK